MKKELKRKYLSNKYRQEIFFNTHNPKCKESKHNHTQRNHGGISKRRLKEDSTRSVSTSFVWDGKEVSLVPLKHVFNKPFKGEENILLDKPFEESEDMYEVIYLDEGELLDDVHSSKDQDLLYGGSNKLRDEGSLSCPTQDEDNEISSEVVCSFHGDELNQDLEMNFFQSRKIDIGVSQQLLLVHSL